MPSDTLHTKSVTPPGRRPVSPIRAVPLAAALLTLGLGGVLCGSAQAAASLDLLRERRGLELPGSALRSAEDQNGSPVAQPRGPTSPEALPPLSSGEPSLEVRAFRLTGARLIPESELQGALADSVGRRLGFSQLQALTKRLALLYRERGFDAVDVYLPRQQARDGVIEMVIEEGRIASLQMETGSAQDAAALRAWTPHLQPGQPLSLTGIERDLLGLSDIEGLNSSVRIEAGEVPGSSDLTLQTRRTESLTGQIDYDNQGILRNAARQLKARLNWLNPGQPGTRWQVQWTGGETGLRQFGLNWTERMADGSRFDLDMGWLDYRVNHPMPFNPFENSLEPNHQTGRGSRLAVQRSVPIQRDRSHGLHSRIRLEVMDAYDQMTTTPVQLGSVYTPPSSESLHQSVQTLMIGLEDRQLSETGQRRTFDLSATLGHFVGRVVEWADSPEHRSISSLRFPGGLSAQKDAPGHYVVMLGRGALSVPLATHWVFNSRADFQLSPGALPRHEQLRLTGPEGVRAWATEESRVDQGFRTSLEWRHIRPRLEAYGFADIAWGTAQPTAAQRSNGAASWFNRMGVGIGFDLRPTQSLRLSTQLAWKLDADPSESSSPLFWFNVKQSF